jgi:hypothetical protein
MAIGAQKNALIHPSMICTHHPADVIDVKIAQSKEKVFHFLFIEKDLGLKRFGDLDYAFVLRT